MNIALFHNVPSGGAKRAIFEWVKRLAERHTIDVYSLDTANHEFCDIRSIANKHYIYPFKTHNLFNSPFGRLNRIVYWRNLRKLNIIHRNIAKDIDNRHYDIIFANTCIFTFIPIFLNYSITPSIYYLHEPFGKNFVRKIKRPYLKNSNWGKLINRYDPFIKLHERYLLTLQENSLTKPRMVLSNSEFTLKNIELLLQSKSALCHLGVDLAAFKPIEGIQKENFILSVGEMTARKGFDFIIKSMSYIPKEKRPSLKIASNLVNLQEKEFIQGLVNSYEIELELLINVNLKDMRLLYNRARLCVYTPYLEPFGLVPLEAMACRTPVIGINEGGIPESIINEKTGLLVERNPQKFGEAISSLLDKPDLAKIYGENAREYVEQNWTWDASTDTLESFLEKAIK